MPTTAGQRSGGCVGQQPTATEWEVRPGDHLWGIARSTLVSHRGVDVSDREVALYWTTLIRVNRSRLSDPPQFHLIYAGQRFELPPMSDQQVS